MNYYANKNSLEYYEMEKWYNPEDNYTFQVLSRNNDTSGNPYRLIVIYDSVAFPVACYESRSSRPNIEYVLFGLENCHKMLTLHLSPSEYNRIKRSMGDWKNKQSDHQHAIGVMQSD